MRIARRSTARPARVVRPLRAAVAAGCLAATGLAAPPPAQAHPHVFIDTGIALVVDGQQVEAIRIVWHFDELYSSFVMEEFGITPETGITDAAQAAMREAIFDALGEYGYFTEVRLDGALLDPFHAHSFVAELAGAALIFRFEIALPEDHRAESIDVVAYDDEYFIYYAVLPGVPRLVATGGGPAELEGLRCSEQRFLRDTFWLGPTDVEGLACTLERAG